MYVEEMHLLKHSVAFFYLLAWNQLRTITEAADFNGQQN